MQRFLRFAVLASLALFARALAQTTPASRIINLSILTDVGTGSNRDFTMGFVVSPGTGTLPALTRAAGPTLTAFGITDAMTDPKLELFQGTGKIGENDNWGGAQSLTATITQAGAFAFSSATSKDAALATTLRAGGHSVKVSGVNNSTGSVLAELYDQTPAATASSDAVRLVNVSVLKEVGRGMTAGFVIAGTTSKTVLVRAVGPGLAAFGTTDALPDPKVELFSSAGQTLATNDNWSTPVGIGALNATTLSSAFASVGAFALPAGSKDAALVANLTPGAYTVRVTGGGTAGRALVEVYEAPATLGGITLGVTRVTPGEILQVAGTGFNPAVDTFAEFTDPTGAKVTVKADVASATALSVTTPFFLDPSNGSPIARTTTLSIVQMRAGTPTTLGAVSNLLVAELPQSTLPAGTITTAYLRAHAAVLLAAQQNWAKVETAGNAGPLASNSAKMSQQVTALERSLQAVMQGTSPAAFQGTFNGAPLRMDKTSLALLDRMLLAYGVPGRPFTSTGTVATINGRSVAGLDADWQASFFAALNELGDTPATVSKFGRGVAIVGGVVGLAATAPIYVSAGAVTAVAGFGVSLASAQIASYLRSAGQDSAAHNSGVKLSNLFPSLDRLRQTIAQFKLTGQNVEDLNAIESEIGGQVNTDDSNSALSLRFRDLFKPVIKIVIDDQQRPYGVPNPDFSSSARNEAGQLVSLASLAKLEFVTDAKTTSAAGDYPITYKLTLTSTTNDFYVVPGMLTITRAPLLVIANPKTVLLNADIPPLDVTYDGWRNGDGASLISGVPRVETRAVKGSALGSYPISVSPGTLAALRNYSFVYRDGTLNVVADIDRTAEFETACLGTWRASNGTSTYRLELARGGVGTYYTAENVPYRTTWRIVRNGAEYRLYESGFWHPAYSDYFTPEPLTMPVGTFKTILTKPLGDIPLGSVGVTYSR